MVGEVAEVATERIRQPRRRTDDRWTLNVGADAGMTGRRDDRVAGAPTGHRRRSRRVLAG